MGRKASQLEVAPAAIPGIGDSPEADPEHDDGEGEEIDLEANFDSANEAQMRKLTSVAKDTLGPRRSAEEGAGIISRLFFLWTASIFSVAARKRREQGLELEEDDIWELPHNDETSVVSEKFDSAWARKRAKLRPEHDTAEDGLNEREAKRLLRGGLWAMASWPIKVGGIFKFFNTSVQFLNPIILNAVLSFIQDLGTSDQMPLWQGYLLAATLAAAMATKTILENAYFFNVWKAGWRIRSALTTEVYRKSLRLSASSRQSMTMGEIVNLMQLDSTKLELFVATGLHVLWDSAYQIIGYLALLYYYIGWPAFVGLGVLLVAIPIQVVVYGRLLQVNKKIVKFMDGRVKLTNEILQGMLGIKMAAWELKYMDYVNEFRVKEIRMLRSVMFIAAFSVAYMMAVPAFTGLAAISTYAVRVDGAVDAATLFTALNIVSQLRFSIMMLPQALSALAQAQVSFRRIAKYLALEEIAAAPAAAPAASPVDHTFAEDDEDEHGPGRPAIEVQEGVFFWKHPGLGEHADRPALRGINLEIDQGKLTAVVGPVGSGKSSLVAAILGEMHCQVGEVHLSGSVAYAAQSAWIFNASVRANILFGEAYDEERYRRVLRACQLNHDLDVLPDGDQTIIGERGINLSGGQKQRVNVARVAYSRHDIVILDDPLSALDPEVARRLFQDCIIGLLADRTRVLVTNQLNVLPSCDKIVVLDSAEDSAGHIVEQGRYSALVSSGLNFAKLMNEYNGGAGDDENSDHVRARTNSDRTNEEEDDTNDDGVMDPMERALSSMNGGENHEGLQDNKGGELMQEEERNAGAVSFAQYRNYIRAGGGLCLFALLILGSLLGQLMNVGNSLWVSIWSEDTSYENRSLTFYLVGYAVVAFLLAIFSYIRSILVFYLALRASRQLHKDLLSSIMHAPMQFFDTTPIGRVLNRFSKDLYLADSQLPMSISFFLMMTFSVLASLATVGASTPLFFAAIPFLLIIYLAVMQRYRPVARDMKRLESISRSPMYAHFSETLGGLSTIRAFNFAARFVHENETKVDHNLKFWYTLKSCERWLSVRLEMLGASITLLAGVFAIYSASQGALSAGIAGLSLSFAMTATTLLTNTVRSFTELETGMNCVERILHYSSKIDQEASFTSTNPPPPEWPSRGEVNISNLSARYRKETPLVLNGVDLHIPGGSRVGIVGRTGAGKSSFLSALLRLIEPEKEDPEDPGPISIDGVDVSKIGLHELRSKISIVPQSPVLFSGTVRSNLDPFESYSDNQVWSALEKCAMSGTVREMGGLDAVVAEYGENFSQGERQLLCLVRSVLSQARILLLDEATSSVDFATDTAIQSTIRDSFNNATIITIAHRLATVIENDFILVLGNGSVLEYDDPATLLEDPSSELSSMVAELGASTAAQLRRRAREARDRRNQRQ
ncbi:ABC transporter, putative [Hondaea fermentalgiana]|uniref:ABC transporter, putative n=1 Tax=Hondaea fermentalgiana TaxID=2315210 RepID=A0A2R5GN95_9STRA|nr:ABC transporter, putative [Hondaea fermentalgiana]|eukprot:GBG31208.1 ABC transporter, putative [Hondaea fermentalgiana]